VVPDHLLIVDQGHNNPGDVETPHGSSETFVDMLYRIRVVTDRNDLRTKTEELGNTSTPGNTQQEDERNQHAEIATSDP
jgi:hypothetical protein